MKRRYSLEQLAIWIGGAILLYLFVKTFWPVLLLLFAYLGYQIYRIYRQSTKEKVHINDYMREDEDLKYERDLFQQQVETVKRKENGEVVDAEFFVKDRQREQEHRQTR